MPASGRQYADHAVNVTTTPSPCRPRRRIPPKSVCIHSDGIVCKLNAWLHAVAVGAHREVVRAKALLMESQGMANTAIAQALPVSPGSVANWRARLAEDGVARLGQVRK